MEYQVQDGRPEQQERSTKHLDLIEDNWIVDCFGFVDIDYFIDCCVRYRKEAVSKALFNKRVFPNVCCYPDQVTIHNEE